MNIKREEIEEGEEVEEVEELRSLRPREAVGGGVLPISF